MSFKCSICGKKPSSGHTISHSRRHIKRVFKPNLRRQRIILNGKIVRSYVCTSCLKSGKVRKAG
ncbi:MAG: 50S ribosomal protein L28 [Elusimicrobia bacterium]|nr:50S ribosomal protein L28 [Elusimicrobiota bacterium]